MDPETEARIRQTAEDMAQLYGGTISPEQTADVLRRALTDVLSKPLRAVYVDPLPGEPDGRQDAGS